MIRIGPAGWSYKDWKGIVYPASQPKGFQELTYISEFFDTVEINVTFYRPIPARTIGTRARRTNACSRMGTPRCSKPGA